MNWLCRFIGHRWTHAMPFQVMVMHGETAPVTTEHGKMLLCMREGCDFKRYETSWVCLETTKDAHEAFQ
jgi:hypothetical protein